MIRVQDIVRLIQQSLRPVRNKIMLSIARGITSAVKDSGANMQMQATFLADEVKDQVEYFRHFGFANNPPPGSECIAVSVGGNRDHAVIIATENGGLRLKVDAGDSALYNEKGKYVWLKGDNLEISLDKLKVSNGANELIAVLSEFMDEVNKGLVITAIGPQPWTADTLAKLEAVKVKLDTFKD